MSFIRGGGSKEDAATLFEVSRSTVYVWLNQPEGYVGGKPGPRGSRKFDRAALLREVQANPEVMQKELAEKFKVSKNAICHAFKCLGIKRKKRRFAIGKVGIKKVKDAAS